jgi:hypothetical protein
MSNKPTQESAGEALAEARYLRQRVYGGNPSDRDLINGLDNIIGGIATLRAELDKLRAENYTDLLDQMDEAWGQARTIGREEVTAFLVSRMTHTPTTRLRAENKELRARVATEHERCTENTARSIESVRDEWQYERQLAAKASDTLRADLAVARRQRDELAIELGKMAGRVVDATFDRDEAQRDLAAAREAIRALELVAICDHPATTCEEERLRNRGMRCAYDAKILAIAALVKGGE